MFLARQCRFYLSTVIGRFSGVIIPIPILLTKYVSIFFWLSAHFCALFSLLRQRCFHRCFICSFDRTFRPDHAFHISYHAHQSLDITSICHMSICFASRVLACLKLLPLYLSHRSVSHNSSFVHFTRTGQLRACSHVST